MIKPRAPFIRGIRADFLPGHFTTTTYITGDEKGGYTSVTAVAIRNTQKIVSGRILPHLATGNLLIITHPHHNLDHHISPATGLVTSTVVDPAITSAGHFYQNPPGPILFCCGGTILLKSGNRNYFWTAAKTYYRAGILKNVHLPLRQLYM